MLWVGKDTCELLPAPELRGLEMGATFDALRRRFGAHTSFFCIGPAGEMCLGAAAVATTDRTGAQVRFAARGGLGAVMGSKGIKAIVFDDTGARPDPAHDPEGLAAAGREVWQILRDDPKTQNRHDFGTPAVLAICDSLGILPTRNSQTGHFEEFDAISGERVADLIVGRGGEGERGLLCVRGCNIQCSNEFADPKGKTLVASLQYENIGLLGSNCGIGDVDEVARINHLCNQVGVDTIEAGAAIGVAMEAGVIAFGDAKGAKDLVGRSARARRSAGCWGAASSSPGGLGGQESSGREGPGDTRLRSAIAQGHRCDVRHLPDGRRPHRGKRAGDGQGARSEEEGGAGRGFIAAPSPGRAPRQPGGVSVHPPRVRQGPRT